MFKAAANIIFEVVFGVSVMPEPALSVNILLTVAFKVDEPTLI